MKKKIKRISALCLCLTLLLSSGCGKADDHDNEIISRSSLDNEQTVTELLEYNGTMLGESTVIRKLLCEILPGSISLASYDIILNRLTIEYASSEPDQDANDKQAENERKKLSATEFASYWNQTNTEDIIFYNSSALFALIPNLDSIQYLIEGYEVPTFTISRSNMEGFYGSPLQDIGTVELWHSKISAEFLNNEKIAAFFKDFPLAKRLDTVEELPGKKNPTNQNDESKLRELQ